MAPDSKIEISPSSNTGTLPRACLDLCSADLRPSLVKGMIFTSYSKPSSSRSQTTRPALVPATKCTFNIIYPHYFLTIFSAFFANSLAFSSSSKRLSTFIGTESPALIPGWSYIVFIHRSRWSKPSIEIPDHL